MKYLKRETVLTYNNSTQAQLAYSVLHLPWLHEAPDLLSLIQGSKETDRKKQLGFQRLHPSYLLFLENTSVLPYQGWLSINARNNKYTCHAIILKTWTSASKQAQIQRNKGKNKSKKGRERQGDLLFPIDCLLLHRWILSHSKPYWFLKRSLIFTEYGNGSYTSMSSVWMHTEALGGPQA